MPSLKFPAEIGGCACGRDASSNLAVSITSELFAGGDGWVGWGVCWVYRTEG